MGTDKGFFVVWYLRFLRLVTESAGHRLVSAIEHDRHEALRRLQEYMEFLDLAVARDEAVTQEHEFVREEHYLRLQHFHDDGRFCSLG